jgi:von Willebrand factor type A domain
MVLLLSFLAPARLWLLLLLIPLLVLLYLWMVQRNGNRTKQVSKTMFDLVIPRERTWLRLPPDPDNPKAVPPARIVLLSDGKTQVGRPSDQAAMAARAQSVAIYTIAYGTPNGYIDIGGRREPVPVDRAEMARIAKISGGAAYTAESAGELKQVYRVVISVWLQG